MDDVCKAIHLIINKAPLNEVINVGNGRPIIFKDIIDQAVKITRSSSKINLIEPPKFHDIVQVKDMYLDNKKLRLLGFQSQISLEQGITQLCQT